MTKNEYAVLLMFDHGDLPVRTLRTHPEFFAPGLRERLDAAIAGRDYVLHAIEVLGRKAGGKNA